MKKVIGYTLLLCSTHVYAQKHINIRVEDVSKTISVLASDSLQGRKVFTPEIDKAAQYIAEAFQQAGLKPLKGNSFLQSFSMVSATQESLTAKSNGTEVDPQKIVLITSKPQITLSSHNLSIEKITATDNFFSKAIQFAASDKDLLVVVDPAFADRFPRLSMLKRSFFQSAASVAFVLGDVDTQNLTITASHNIKEHQLANVVGILPGKKKADEYVIFSAHYDHLGIGKPVNGDSIYNGANDNASGTTAVIELAKYFKAKGDNERTLIFAAFTAEESGGFGSQYFSKQLPPEKVVAMLNIEMIGTDSKWGKNSAYITGFEKTDLGTILQKNLKGTDFNFYPDPYPDQQLFYRSDNATLARLGVAAHTISTSKMDNEPNYHKPSDEVSTLDFENMTAIIKAIALSAKSIIAGTDTPSRVDTSDLR